MLVNADCPAMQWRYANEMNENEGEPTRILARHNASCRVHTVSDYELPRDNEYSNS